MIIADKRDYRKAYVRHKIACENMSVQNKYSRNLLLFYSVECGLKYLLMHKWNIRSIKDIEKDEEKKKLLGTHNLKLILKELNQQKLVDFNPYFTNHGDLVDVNTYHQAFRYGIECDRRDVQKEDRFGKDLKDVDQWIGEEMN